MRIFVLTATYELRVSRKSHLRAHPNSQRSRVLSRVSFETSSDLKQPKREQKLVFRHYPNICFGCFASTVYWNIDFLCFDWTETNRKPIESVWYATYFGIFSGNLGFFHFFSVCFGLFQNSLFRLFHFYTETESFDILIEPKQTEDQPKQFDREHILIF